MIGNLEPEESVMGKGKWLGELSKALQELEMNEADLEVVIGGTSIYEIEGAGTKWAPVKGTRKYNKDAFIVIRRPNPPKSSLPMVDFHPQHDAYEWDHADYQESVK